MEPCASSYRHVGIRRPKLSLVRFEFQLVQLPLCSLVSFQAFQVHIANGQRPDVTSVILLGNRQPGPLQSTNSAHHWSWRSISGHPHLPRTGERHLRQSHIFKGLWREGKQRQHTIFVKVRRWPKKAICDGARPKNIKKWRRMVQVHKHWNRKKGEETDWIISFQHSSVNCKKGI